MTRSLTRVRSLTRRRLRIPWAWLCIVGCAIGSLTASAQEWTQQLDAGVRARDRGDIAESIELLEATVARAPDDQARVRAMTQLGVSLTQAGRLSEAESILNAARARAAAGIKPSVSLALGNLAAKQRNPTRATQCYQEVLTEVPATGFGRDAGIAARLNLAHMRPPRERLPILEKLWPDVALIDNRDHRARAYLSVGQQAIEGILDARLSDEADPVKPVTRLERTLRLAYLGFTNAGELAEHSGSAALAVQSTAGLAQLYETQGHLQEAMALNRKAAQSAQALPPGRSEELLVGLDWQAGRLSQMSGDDSAARLHFLHAAAHLEAIRPDLPIADATGRSTFQTLIQPITVGLADLLLRDFDALAASEQRTRLASIVDVVELTRQAELQDFLGDRCSVDSVKEVTDTPLAAAIAVVYPMIFRDRLEIIVRMKEGALRRSVPVKAVTLNAAITAFRSELIDPGSGDFKVDALRLYHWLIEPFDAQLAQAGVRQLVIVPDGPLRLIPFAALHDGHGFLAERYAISTVTGLTMTTPTAAQPSATLALLAGLSEPGPVASKLASMGFVSGFAGSQSALALPGVRAELRELAPLTRSVTLLDKDFTVDRFRSELQTRRYRRVHIASHGFFGTNAQESFLLAYDNVIRLDDLQGLISGTGAGGEPGDIDLLTLSACDTATGDDRAPLGFAGAAIKAHAHSVVGSLWPVGDVAAQKFMEALYGALRQHGKAEAITLAQRTLMQTPQFEHPYYWAPFVLIGDWN